MSCISNPWNYLVSVHDEVGVIIGVIAKLGDSTLVGVESGSKELDHNRVLQKFLEEASNKEFGASSKAFFLLRPQYTS